MRCSLRDRRLQKHVVSNHFFLSKKKTIGVVAGIEGLAITRLMKRTLQSARPINQELPDTDELCELM